MSKELHVSALEQSVRGIPVTDSYEDSARKAYDDSADLIHESNQRMYALVEWMQRTGQEATAQLILNILEGKP